MAEQEQKQPVEQEIKQAENQEERQRQAQQDDSLRADNAQERELKLSQDQWLKRIPDDPAGLLRRKFEYQYRQRARTNSEGPPW